jgi:cell division protein FtsB
VKRPLRWGLRWLSRVVVIAIVGAFVTVTGLQYARIIEKNAAMAAQLATAQSDVAALRAKSVDQNREIRRLSDPAGVIPEIHDRLHLVRDNEAIIYLKKHDDGR